MRQKDPSNLPAINKLIDATPLHGLQKDMHAAIKKYPNLYATRLSKHVRILNKETGDFIIAASTGSCRRGFLNFKSDLRKLAV